MLEAVRLMAEKGIGAVLVIDDGSLTGILSERDYLPVIENSRVLGIVSIGDLVKTAIKEQQYTIDQLEHYIAG